MEFLAGQIAALLAGRVEGDEAAAVSGLAKIQEGTPGTLTFLANPKYQEFIYTTGATIAIVDEGFEPKQALPQGLTLIRVANAYASFAQLLTHYDNLKHYRTGIESGAYVDPGAEVAEDAYIGTHAYIAKGAKVGTGAKVYPGVFVGDGARIGERTVLMPGVQIHRDCIIGNDCIIHSGTVIGADGFGFAPNAENGLNKVPQIGNVIIQDRVEIGANSCVDRATLGSTVIRSGAKLDNLVQVAHNVVIGENTVIAGQTGIAGSTTIGKNCMIGGQVGIVGHLTIGNDVKIAAQSGIGSNLADEEIVQGSPAFGIRDYKVAYVHFRKLPELAARLEALEKQINELKPKQS
jgi:UDP-3-O-[3-hydroxymyristoyl] glucosamine N-acyltransferase